MGIANMTHWIGVFLLFASSILLLVTTISTPIWNNDSMLRVTLQSQVGLHHTQVKFGTFGYCFLNLGPDGHAQCTHSHLGYSPATIMASIDKTDVSVIEAGTTSSLTRVMVLHPIECGFAFIAFLLAVGHGVVGSLAGALLAFVTWILVLISLACDFTLFGLVRHQVNHDDTGNHANFGSAIWCEVASFVTLFVGMILVFFTCISNRRKKNRHSGEKRDETVDTNGQTPRRKKRFGLF